MEHLSTDTIITYIDGATPEAERPGVEAHLAACRECSESMKQYQALELRLRLEPQLRPPADKVKAFLDRFPVPSQPERSSLRQIIASLVFDSLDQPAFAGVRAIGGLGAHPDQMIFRAGDIDVDITFEPTRKPEIISLTGQILTSRLEFFMNRSVGLESEGVVRYVTQTNVVGEFSFDVPKDTYNLSIDLPEGELRIFGVRPASERK